jgi:hypothetical protein
VSRKWRSLQALVIGLAVAGAGCLVEVNEVADPRPAFERARHEASRYQGRPGPAHELNVLAYDRDEGRLVRVSLPMWMVRKLEDEEIDLDGHDRVEATLRNHLSLRDIERSGLGVLIEVEERESQVLVWLR